MHFSMRVGTVSKMYPVAFLAIIGFLSSFSSAQFLPDDWKRLIGVRAVSFSNQNFTKSVYQILAQKEGNIFFSPISIEVALALAYLGAGGETASQMARGLHLPNNNNEIITMGFNTLIAVIKSDDKTSLEVANKIFTDNTITLKEEFQGIANTSFYSDVEAVDFKHNHEAARVQINQWVEGKTNQKIKDLLAPGIITPESALVLVNALYFKAEWASKFSNYSTRPEPFFLTPTQTKDVQMMHKTSRDFGYNEIAELDCKLLELPFEGEKVSMVVLLPNKLDGLANLETKLATANLGQLLNDFRQSQVVVTLPKIKVEQSTDLNAVLKTLGMVDMFEDNANFTELTDAPVKVSKVVHKAFINVDEDGSEAAAATGLVMENRSLIVGVQPPKEFKADHPFLFVILEKQTQVILFIGSVSNPS